MASTKVAADDAVQSPVPVVGLLPCMIAVLVQISLSASNGRAIVAVVGKSFVIITLAVFGQPFLVTDQVKVLPPDPNPVTLVVFRLGSVILPDPPDNIHEPVPGNGLSAVMV